MKRVKVSYTGFPGWHIECSAMSIKYLGEHFDVHTGGEDHIPIHHTNEIAQSEAATGKKFVNYWMHVAFLTFKGEKVSKSTGGLYTLSELEKLGYNPLVYRYFTLQTHYRKHLDFTIENLDAAKTAYDRLKRKVLEIKGQKHKGEASETDYGKLFLEAINDDLNTPLALQVLWKLVDDFDYNPKDKIKLIEKFDSVLGLDLLKEEKVDIPSEIMEMVEKREIARKNKDWKAADLLRGRIGELGFIVEDREDGPRVSKK